MSINDHYLFFKYYHYHFDGIDPNDNDNLSDLDDLDLDLNLDKHLSDDSTKNLKNDQSMHKKDHQDANSQSLDENQIFKNFDSVDEQDKQDQVDASASEDSPNDSDSVEYFKNQLSAMMEDRKKEQQEILRARADLENLKKRLLKEKQESIKYALISFVKDLLPCIDSFERAMSSPHPDQTNQSSTKTDTSSLSDLSDLSDLYKGIDLVYKQLMMVLQKHGLTKIDAADQPFDPDLHQVVRKELSKDVNKDMVSQVYQNGYQFNQRLIRAAMVSIYSPDESQKAKDDRTIDNQAKDLGTSHDESDKSKV